VVVAALALGGIAVLLSAADEAFAQRGRRGMYIEPNIEYDGRFTFARIRYQVYRQSGWEFDYPEMERNLMTMVREITSLNAHDQHSNVHDLDDPALLRYPIAYLSEPGYWYPSDSEAEGLRNYLTKGGFLIVDDFRLGEWVNFEAQMRRVLPDAKIEHLPLGHPVFNSFYSIASLDMDYPGNPNIKAEFLGIHEDNDPTKRLLVVINYNTDIGDYMEHSGRGWWPVNITNDAYKFAINYLLGVRAQSLTAQLTRRERAAWTQPAARRCAPRPPHPSSGRT
jgi:hypothetical protein